MEDDRLWFEAHPNRKYRLRDPLDGELAKMMWGENHFRAVSQVTAFVQETERAGWRVILLVIQLEPSVRMRQLARLPPELSDPLDSLTDRGIEKLFPGIPTEPMKHIKSVHRLDGKPTYAVEPVPVDFPRSR